MDHVDKKPKVERSSDKENNRKDDMSTMTDLQALVRSGRVMEYGAPQQRPSSSSSTHSYSSHFQNDDPRAKKPWEYRIPEVLEMNLEHKKNLEQANGAQKSAALIKTEGDIPNLCLHSSFFVEGVRIGWPFPVIMPPQRQMALHLIKALKNRRHVVLESPTGTGKSAAILCSVLAWQRHHRKTHAHDGQATPRVIYCSRTHSQVAQMVASLRKTPYRPRMTVLGSRERLCIHKKIRNRGPEQEEGSPKQQQNVNQECRCRVGNTEGMRKRMWQSQTSFYDDDNPPDSVEMDTSEAPQQQQQREEEHEDGEEWIDPNASKKPTCPHYRQLTATRTATMTYEQLVPQEQQVACCTQGGEHTKLGTHDIEDLVSFGMDPYQKRGVAVYRSPSQPSFGMGIGKSNETGHVIVGSLSEGGAIEQEGTTKLGDSIIRLNGQETASMTLDQVANTMRSTEDPLLLDVSSDVVMGADETGYSEHSPCPYYLSRALEKHAELIFAPYNYVLDPSIRKSLGIDLAGAICVLDEAHNVEDTLRESGSGKFGEIELCEMLEMLLNFAGASKTHRNIVQTEDGEMNVGDIAHSLLLFVEQLITFLMEAKTRFEQNPGNNGARKVIADWEKFHTPDNTEFDMTFDGPTGHGKGGKAIGCQTFFDKLSLTPVMAETLLKHAEALEGYVRSREGGAEWIQAKYTTLIDNLSDMIERVTYALEEPSSYFVASVVKANGSLDFAAGMASSGLRSQRDNGFKRKPKKMPKIPRDGVADRCYHPECRTVTGGPHYQQEGIRHGTYCNGQEHAWEAFLVLQLLTPAKFMNPLAEQCHTVVLASGSLSPIMSLCGELGLTVGPSEDDVKKAAAKPTPVGDIEAKALALKMPRLQLQPKPLEANHVINLEKQLLAVSVGHFSDGSPITMTYSHYSKPEFITKLGDAIASAVEHVPHGGVLVFLPSYSLLRKCVNNWNPSASRRRWGMESYMDDSVWDRLESSKGKVIVEPSGSQAKFEEARDDYADTIRTTGNCILLAVFRGKMSEGISFNDDNARAVICVGIPFPQIKSQQIKAKMDYNTEQRRFHRRNDLLPGNEWYSQQAYRAIAQALGRCIRHAADYGSIILMDSRHCDDGAPSMMDGVCNAHRQLPKWMRHRVRNLSKRDMGDGYGKSIAGSWNGLGREMTRFFEQAPIHSRLVLEQQNESLQRARARDRAEGGLTPQQQQSQATASTQNSAGSTPISAQITPTPNTPASFLK